MRKAGIASWILILLLFGSVASYSSTAVVQSRRCTLTIRNNSGRDFYRLHLSWSGDKDWGPNLLQTPLRPGMSFDRVVVPAQYDLLLVDGKETPCIVRGVRVVNDMSQPVTDSHCQGGD